MNKEEIRKSLEKEMIVVLFDYDWQLISDKLDQVKEEERERMVGEIKKRQGITNSLRFGSKIIKELKKYQSSYGIEDMALVDIAGITKNRVVEDILHSIHDNK